MPILTIFTSNNNNKEDLEMPLSQQTKTDLVFKKIKGRRVTSLDKAFYEEFPGALTYLHAGEVWSETVPTPAPGVTTSVVQYYADLKLTEDITVADHKGWLACSTPNDISTQLKGFIPPRFDQTYTVRIFEDDGSGNIDTNKEVPTAHPTNWFFDYENGVLMFENDPEASGLTTPFHIRVYRYIGETVETSAASVDKKMAFLKEANSVAVTGGNNSVDVTSDMSGKTPGGNETTVGVVTTTPYNRCPVLTYPDRDEVLTTDGNKVFGRLTESGGTWTLYFYYIEEDGTETNYAFPSNTNIIWGYYEVLEFNDWPTFDDNAVFPSDQIVGDIPYATTTQGGKVKLGEDNETSANEAVRTDDPRAVKGIDFALTAFTADGTNINLTVGAGVYNKDGDKTTSTTLTMSQTASTYYMVYVDLNNGSINYSSGASPQTAPLTGQALYRFSTDASNTVSTVEDVRPIYTLSLGGGLGPLGVPTDGTYTDGLLGLNSSTQVNDAVDDINEVLKYLAPDDAEPLEGDINWSTTFTSGKISDGVPTNGYLNPGDSTSFITRDTSFIGTTPDPSTKFHQADTGSLAIFLDDNQMDDFDLESYFNESERDGNQSYTPAASSAGYINVTSVGKYNDFPMWQKGNAEVRFGTTYGNSNLSVGDHQIRLEHESEATNTTTLFVDNESSRPSIGDVNAVEGATVNFKYLSGVKFYGLNTEFDITVSADYLFEYTYIENDLIEISMPGGTITLDIWDDANISIPPQYDDLFSATKTLVLNQSNVSTTDGSIETTPYDPWGEGISSINAETRLINTYGNVSTELNDIFQDENRRLPSSYNFDNASGSLTGQWDSTALLSNGDAQVFNGSLVYPSGNSSTYPNPDQNSSLDYSTFSGDQVYYRSMYQASTPHNSGQLQLDNITWSAISNGNVKVEIKLPSQSGWLDLGKDYNAAIFSGTDGDGAMTGHSQSGNSLIINWTAGTLSTANSGYRYFVRITLANNSNSITRIAEIGW